MFKLNMEINRGVQMVFKNGMEISVQWGPMNYCANYSRDVKDCDNCKNAEVAVFYHSPSGEIQMNINDFLPNGYEGYMDDVAPYLTPDDVAAFIAVISSATPEYIDRLVKEGKYS